MSGRGIQVERYILDLFSEHNRPFSVQGVADYLGQHGIKKTIVQKTMDALVEAGKITVKEFGKTKIFWPDQSQLDVLGKEELESKKKELKELKEVEEKENEELNRLQKEYSALTTSFTISQIEEKIQKLALQKEEDEKKLKIFTEKADLVNQEERVAAEKDLETHLKIWRKWKSTFREIWGTLSENIEKKDSEMFEEIGIETDEEAGSCLEVLSQLVATKKRKMR